MTVTPLTTNEVTQDPDFERTPEVIRADIVLCMSFCLQKTQVEIKIVLVEVIQLLMIRSCYNACYLKVTKFYDVKIGCITPLR